MPVQLLSAAERDRANRFPSAITEEDLITCFTLSEEDRKQIPVHAGPQARLGFGLELCALRFMGFVPDDLTSACPSRKPEDMHILDFFHIPSDLVVAGLYPSRSP